MDYKHINNLLLLQIKDEIKNLILYIQKKYSKQLSKEDANALIDEYSSSINFIKYSKDDKAEINHKIKKAIYTRKFRNSFLIKTDQLKFDKSKCHARVWNNGSIIKTEEGKIIYGKQCSKKICKSSKTYCSSHNKNNPHGDFNKEASKQMKLHYKKEGSFDEMF